MRAEVSALMPSSPSIGTKSWSCAEVADFYFELSKKHRLRRYGTMLLLTKARWALSDDQDGTFMVPWPP